MADAVGHGEVEAPTAEEIAAALAAVRTLLRRRDRAGRASRWLRAGRAEAMTAPPRPASWATAERPR